MAASSCSKISKTVSKRVTCSRRLVRSVRCSSRSVPPRFLTVMYLPTSMPIPALSMRVTSVMSSTTLTWPCATSLSTWFLSTMSPSSSSSRPFKRRMVTSPTRCSTISMGFCTCLPLQSVEILDADDFVTGFVVNQLVHQRTSHGQAEAAGPDAFFFAFDEVAKRIVGRIRDGGVQQLIDVESFARIRDAIEQHPLRADAGNPDFLCWILLAAPFDGVREQFAEGLRHGFAHRLRQIGFEVHHERLNAVGHLERTRHDDFKPLRLRGHHLDRERRRGRR